MVRDTYKYHFKQGRRIVHTSITNDPERREAEHRENFGSRRPEMPPSNGSTSRLPKVALPGAGDQTTCEGVPVALYLRGLSLLIGIVAVVIPVAISLAGFYVSRRFSSRMDSLAADLDEALDRIVELESPSSAVAGQHN